MTDNKIAAKELADKHVKAVAAWQAAIMKLRAAQQALAEAQQENATAERQMMAAAMAFSTSVGIPLSGGVADQPAKRCELADMTEKDHRDLLY